ncbi:MAG TPA: hypothetical protein PL143_06005 [Rhodocyclaceae bacterium]|nr:hypothetical protein [Rhodocyclaceae bacterium]
MTMDATSTLTRQVLRQQSRAWLGTGAVSEELPGTQFRPAFKDIATGKTYLARYADGTPAPMHLLDGLPDELVVRRDTAGHAAAIKGSIVAGFVRCGRFYSREAVAAQLACSSEHHIGLQPDAPDRRQSHTNEVNKGAMQCLAGH